MRSGQAGLRWGYKPRKQDGRNAERTRRFQERMGALEVDVALPSGAESLAAFLERLAEVGAARAGGGRPRARSGRGAAGRLDLPGQPDLLRPPRRAGGADRAHLAGQPAPGPHRGRAARVPLAVGAEGRDARARRGDRGARDAGAGSRRGALRQGRGRGHPRGCAAASASTRSTTPPWTARLSAPTPTWSTCPSSGTPGAPTSR